MLRVRPAEPPDIPAIVAISRRVQERLSASGSLQEFGPIPEAVVAAHVSARTAFVMEREEAVIGGVFVEPARAPVTAELPEILTLWNLGTDRAPLWFLQKLMIAPEVQSGGLGRVLLEEALRQVAERGATWAVLDCWAGNARLRDFYMRAGFMLHGIFPEEDYEVAVFLRALNPHTGSS